MRRERLTTIFVILLGGCALLTNFETLVLARTPVALKSKPLPAADSAKQRALTAIRCGQERTDGSVNQLAESLSDDRTLVRQAAAWALSQLGEAAEPALPPLTQALSSQDPRVRWAAASALGQLGPKATSAEAALLRTAQDRDLDVRC